MKKTDKKIISIFLVLIILISQFSPIIAGEEEYTYELSLEQYLISSGVDEDGDKRISDEEWKKVKNLDLRDYAYIKSTDLTGIEKAVNLKVLRVIKADLSSIDFSKLKNLQELYIDECSLKDGKISGIDKLSTLKIYDSNLDNCKIENLKNLKSVLLWYCNIDNFDFLSEIKQIKELNLDVSYVENMNEIELDFTEFKNLEKLAIDDENPYEYDSDKEEYVNKYLDRIKKINISELSNLKELSLHDTYNCNIEFSGLNNIEKFNVYNNNIDTIDFTGYENLKEVSIRQFGETLGKDDFKVGENFTAKVDREYIDNAYSLILERQKDVIEIYVGEYLDTWWEWRNFPVVVPESNVLEVLDDSSIKAKSVGEQKIKIIDEFDREIEILVRVIEKNINIDINTELEDTGITAEIVYGNVLKSNGEFWEINSATTAEMIDKNVKRYISDEVYIGSQNYKGYYQSTLYNDSKMAIEYMDGNKKVIDNVKDIGSYLYITNDGKLYKYNFSYITEKCNTKLMMNNMKKIISSDGGREQFIISESGETFDEDCIKIFDFEIREYKESVKNETADGIKYVDVAIDVNGNKWIKSSWYDNEEWRMVNENDNIIEEVYRDGYNGKYLSLSNNKTAHLIYYGETEEEILAAPLILTDVEYIEETYGLDYQTDILIRTDGTIWLYDLKNGLTKITESTSVKDDEEKLIINFNEVSEKNGIISDIELGTTIEDLKTKIKTNGDVKVYTKDGVLIEKNEKLATGMNVEISLGNEKLFFTIAIEGDCNGDGKVRVGDLTTMMVSVAENLASNKDTSKILDGAWKQAVDFNGDGKLNVSDITKLKILIAESK